MDRISKAFQTIKRAEFLPDEVKDDADKDIPLPIGYGQTNSQPYTVELMLTWLDPQPGEKILDVGSGSGWTSALLSYLVGSTGIIYSVEKVPELVEFGGQNCRRLRISNVHFYEATNDYGLPEYAPYDRILVSASAVSLPQELVDQLKVDGRLVIPVQNSVITLDKTTANDYDIREHAGFAFVPLVK